MLQLGKSGREGGGISFGYISSTCYGDILSNHPDIPSQEAALLGRFAWSLAS